MLPLPIPPPPFVFVAAPAADTRPAAAAVAEACRARTRLAHVDAVACVAPRVFFDTVLDALAGWAPAWEHGCAVWHAHGDTVDGFLHGLARLGPAPIVILVERAERLPAELVVPLARLAERVPAASVVFLSAVAWHDIRPALGAAPDPYYIDIDPPAKHDVLRALAAAYRAASSARTHPPALQPLYDQYAETLYNTLSVYTRDPLELQYVAAARWPGFVKPVLDQHDELARQTDDPPALEPPATDGRLRLLKFFLPTFTAALDTLYPRLDNAADWAARHEDDGQTPAKDPTSPLGANSLARMSKFILVAAYLASTNPPRTDVRMFARGPEERRKRRRAPSRPTMVKASQRLLGPATFPLDRLLAILGALLEEHDDDIRPHDPRFGLPGEYTDMEIGRVHVYAAIAELTLVRALHRTGTTDSPPTFRCGISYNVALGLAKDLDIKLGEWLWDPA